MDTKYHFDPLASLLYAPAYKHKSTFLAQTCIGLPSTNTFITEILCIADTQSNFQYLYLCYLRYIHKTFQSIKSI